MIFMLTGREAKVFNPADLRTEAQSAGMRAPADQAANTEEAAPQSAGYGVEYDRHESYTESEQTRFEARGTVTTADGRKIDFSISMSMTRSYHAYHTSAPAHRVNK